MVFESALRATEKQCMRKCLHYHFRSLHWAFDQNCLKTDNKGNAHQLSCLRAGARMLFIRQSIQYSMGIIECVLLQEAIVDLLGGLMTTICRCSRCAFLPVHRSVVSLAAHRTVSCKAASAAFWHSQPLCLKQP